jgi:hypothetical protein
MRIIFHGHSNSHQITGGIVRERAAAGTLVATLITVDADPADTFTHQLIGAPAGAVSMLDNEITVLDGSLLDFEANQSLDFEIKVTDGQGNTFSRPETIQLLDVNETTGTPESDRGATQINGTIGYDIIDALAGLYGHLDGSAVLTLPIGPVAISSDLPVPRAPNKTPKRFARATRRPGTLRPVATAVRPSQPRRSRPIVQTSNG